MDYLTVKEAGEKWGISSRMVTIYCNEERILGAIKKGNLWLIPENAEKPKDLLKNWEKWKRGTGRYVCG